MLTTVIFDLDQTLVDRDATFKGFLEKQFQRFETHLPYITFDDFYKTIKKYDNNGYKEKDEVYQLLCQTLNLEPNLARHFLKDFKDNYGFEPVLFDDVHQTLMTLQEDYTLALITNGRTQGQNAKIDNANLRDYFECIVISESEGIKKPDIRIFQRCLERLDVKAGNAVYIGDNPENDVKAAQACGMKAIWKRNTHYQEIDYADAVVNNISDLVNILETV